MEIRRYLTPENRGRMQRDCELLLKIVRESRGELDLHLRNNYFNVYFQGNSLAKVTFLPGDWYSVEIHEKFFRGTLAAKKFIAETGGSLKGYARVRVKGSELPTLLQKTTINQLQANIRKVHYGEELTFEQLLISDNPPTDEFFFIDRQVTDPHLERRRLDLLALEQIEENRYRFVVVEVKLGKNPELRERVAEQLDGYVAHLSGAAFAEYQACYQRTYEQKYALGLLPKLSHESINIENLVRGMVVVGGYSSLGREQIKDLQAGHPKIEVRQFTYQLMGAAGSAVATSDRFQVATIYATQAHAGHYRKGTSIPYISHPLAVASLVLEHKGDEDEVISALLHDVVEDAGGEGRLADIRAQFGDRVAEIVDGCSDAYGDVAAGVQKPPWKQRKEHHLQQLRGASPSVLLVTAADKLHNARAVVRDYKSVGEQLWSRFNATREESLWYYRSVAEILAEQSASALVEELEGAVQELETLLHGNE